ncbi:hypothetical protein PsorP6_005827 [Peronosclerospora sorghi]|uniref:Uncharacterized protein n=1 Tax=Peronosclerospora sorghi TaxID=230839 RepID=A0ACC0W6W9_9STRA|nr:hypothetical protein PsorP6_005827 [Peronosclerospora sorghi]
MDYELNDQNSKLQCCAVTGLVSRYFCGHEWLAAFLVALVVCIITSAVLPLSLQQVPELKNTAFYGYRCSFAFSTGFVLGLSACFTPD